MTGISGRTLLASTALIFTLSACEDGQLFGPSDSGASSSTNPFRSAPREAAVETREVESPEVFSVNESGLWDGRPSLGGIWVAHPDVTSPERVKIENVTNGRVVSGALFRRERNNPGPRIQMSSDAADALGALAGQPTELKVVALREEEVEIEPILAPDAGEGVEGEAVDGDGAMVAGAATVDDLATGTGDAAMATAEAAPKPKRQGFFASLFGGGASQTEPIETEVVSADGDVIVTEGAEAPGVETASLDDPIAAASAAIDEAEANSSPAASGGLANPFVQVGLFTNEENANAAADNLREIGIVPEVVAGTNGDRQFWRVLVGPMAEADDQTFMLEQIRLLGYKDAFLAPS